MILQALTAYYQALEQKERYPRRVGRRSKFPTRSISPRKGNPNRIVSIKHAI